MGEFSLIWTNVFSSKETVLSQIWRIIVLLNNNAMKEGFWHVLHAAQRGLEYSMSDGEFF